MKKKTERSCVVQDPPGSSKLEQACGATMPLSEDERIAQIAERLLVQRMKLPAEIDTVLSITLESLRWFKLLCAKESLAFGDITPEFLIKKLAGKEVCPEDLQAVRAEVIACIENGELLQPSRPVRRKRGKGR